MPLSTILPLTTMVSYRANDINKHSRATKIDINAKSVFLLLTMTLLYNKITKKANQKPIIF